MPHIGFLIGIGLVFLGVKGGKRASSQYQVLVARSKDGAPLKVAVPLAPLSSEQANQTGERKRLAFQPRHIVQSVVANRGAVYAPSAMIQPGVKGASQPAPILITQNGSASLAIGSTLDIQRALNALGCAPKLVENGQLNSLTVAAIKGFQGRVGSVTNGNAGSATKTALSAALMALLAPSQLPHYGAAQMPGVAQKWDIREIQSGLNRLGLSPPLPVDGKVTQAFVASVKAFQVVHGLPPNGIVDQTVKAGLSLAPGKG